MSIYSNSTKICGVPVGVIMRNGYATGEFTLVFERSMATLEQIEAINWAQPTVSGEGANVLPVGYGFDLKDITYSHSDGAYRVTITVGQQYLGDVTGYQEQVAELTTTVEQQAGELAAKDAEIEAKDSLIADQAAEIAGLAADSAAALRNDMAEAYQEGVETVG